MLWRLRSTLTSLVFLKEEEVLSAVHSMAPLVPVAMALMALFTALPLMAGSLLQRVEVGAAMLLAWAAVGWLLHQGRIRLASLIFIAGTWTVATYCVTTRGGVRSPAYLIYLVLITYAAFVVTPRAALAVFAVSLLVGLGTVVAAENGTLPVPAVAHTPITLYASYSACMLMVILVVLKVTAAYRDAFGKLRASEERFRSLVETTSDWIWEVDRNGVYTYASPKVQELLGYEPSEVLGRTPYDLMPPEEAQRVAGIVRPFFESAQPFSHVENTNLHKDGHEVVLDTSGVPVFDGHGACRGFRGIDRDVTEQRRAEEALRESQARYRQFLQISAEGIWRLEALPPIPTDLSEDEQAELMLQRTRVAECNEAIARRYGFRGPEEMVGTSLDALWVETHENKLAAALQFIRGGYRVTDLETSGQLADGSRGHFLDNLVGVVEGGLLIRAWATERDVTHRRRAEEALRASEERFRAIVESTRDWIWFADVAGVHTYSNRAIQDTLGHAPEEIVGESVYAFMHPDDVARARAEVERAIAARSGWSGLVIRWRHQDGTYRYLESTAAPAFGPTGDLLGWYGADRDITERVRMQEALRDSEAHLRALFAAMSDVVLVLDAEGRHLEIAPTKPGLLHYSAEDLLGRKVHEVLPAEQADYFVASIRQALTAGRTIQIEDRLLLDGRERHFSAAVSPLSSDTAMVVVRDITTMVEQQNRLLAAERARADLAQHLNEEINHRARNNLAMIAGLLQMQALQQPDSELAHRLREAVGRMRSFVDIHEKIYATGAEEADLLEVVQQVAGTLRTVFSGTAAEFTVEGASGLLPTRAVTNLAVLTNELMTNALKHGGAGAGRAVEVRICIERVEGRVEISVWNSGPPVPDGFEVAAQQGMGLRLVSSFAEQYGGSFSIRPEEGGTLAHLMVEEAALD